MASTTHSSNSAKRKPLLVGFVVDVSSSMRRNWKNNDGKEMPRIEVVRDALNQQIKKASLARSKSKQGLRTVDIFCLGMGFKRKMYWSTLNLSYGKETSDSSSDEKVDAGVVCDLIALSEIVPTSSQLKKLEISIVNKWEKYASNLMEKASEIDESVYEDFRIFLQQGMLQTATDKLKGSALYRIWTLVKESEFAIKYEISRSWLEQLANYIKAWEERIDSVAESASKRYVADIVKEAQKHFEEHKPQHEKFIESTLKEFVENLTSILLKLLSVGHSPSQVMDYFDEDKVLNLSQRIYSQLEEQVLSGVRVAWALNRGSLFLSSKSIRASLDSKKIESLTEKCVQKYSWSLLEPFVRAEVENVFKSVFEQQAKEQLSDWIGLASSREVSRSIKQVANLLPDSLEHSLYSEEFMFGATPVSKAMELASLRLLDKSRKNRMKVLVIISDGEFDNNSPLETAYLLRKAGVLIVCCQLTSKDIMTKLLKSRPRFWPEGAKKMFDMASTLQGADPLVEELSTLGYEVPEGTKSFYQINQSELLEDILAILV